MKKLKKDKRGFTLIEIVAILAVIAILVAVISPMIIGYIKDARIRKAQADVKTIGTAILAFAKDTRRWPVYSDATTEAYDALQSKDGDTPGLETGVTIPSEIDDIENQLVTNEPGYPDSGKRKWKGPYLEKVGADPWGHKYYVDVKGLRSANINLYMPAFCISAGPNGKLETAFGQEGPGITIGGDDIVFRIK